MHLGTYYINILVNVWWKTLSKAQRTRGLSALTKVTSLGHITSAHLQIDQKSRNRISAITPGKSGHPLHLEGERGGGTTIPPQLLTLLLKCAFIPRSWSISQRPRSGSCSSSVLPPSPLSPTTCSSTHISSSLRWFPIKRIVCNSDIHRPQHLNLENVVRNISTWKMLPAIYQNGKHFLQYINLDNVAS